ncbi:type II toxin-antitoxin system RelE/ParE family toxin [Oceanicella sp. SM1341]|uniref:type II toxin-antitoxin system RelE family toxin n=1 Tax=Oceanicella sp. SM1341 TaxID=1548889 RepID=UPI000E4CE99F|nr:type II toxin-antitoxin system RelE/ParE family toxin [Oceanicella sp. SM1341]
MTYELEFEKRALKEWNKLGAPLREQFKKKLAERLEAPRVEADRLRGVRDVYKIKLRSSGYRLVYRVEDDVLVVFVVHVGRRDRVYQEAERRLKSDPR